MRSIENIEQLWRRARTQAHRFLGRYHDPVTRAEREDIAQDSAIAAWRWAAALRDPHRFGAAVRTIARRTRYRVLSEHHRRRVEECAVDRVGEEREPASYAVAGRRVPREWLVPRVARAVARLRPIDRCILAAAQEGFCGAEIADRYQLTEHNVKVRTHRARRRVREEIEDAVRTAVRTGGFDRT